MNGDPDDNFKINDRQPVPEDPVHVPEPAPTVPSVEPEGQQIDRRPLAVPTKEFESANSARLSAERFGKTKKKLWLLGVLLILIALIAVFILTRPKASAPSVNSNPSANQVP